MRKILISIVTPCYNEELNVREHFDRVSKVIDQYRDEYDFEHIYTDNCSRDNTFGALAEIAKDRPNVRVIRFSNNIGANRAIFMGLKASRGDATILIQADLQDPPEMIKTFIDEWKAGHEVVYGKIQIRHEGLLLRSLRKLYYYIVDNLSDVPIPQNAGEFRLTSRRVLDALLTYQEDDPYVRGAIARIGFKQKAIPYERFGRKRGVTSTNFLFLISYAINGLVSTSVAPIRFVSAAGIFFSSVGFILTIVIILSKIFLPSESPRGFTTLAVLVTFFGGLQLLGIGIIGEYLRKTYLQVLSRPLGFIDRTINVDTKSEE